MNLFELARDTDLPSVFNEETRAMALYIMQNMHGLIKIGRSANPVQRQRQLRSEGQCAVDIVATFPASGHLEELAHTHLERHRVALEWFRGDPVARRVIEGVVSDNGK